MATTLQYQYRSRQTKNCPARQKLQSENSALNPIPLRIVHFHLTEQASLRFQQRAVAHDYDLSVGGIKIFLRGIEDVGRCKSQNALAISFEIILRQSFKCGRGELSSQAILRCQAQ